MLKIPPPVIAATIALGMWLLSRYVPLLRLDEPWFSYPGYLLIVAGLSLDVIGAIQFRRARTTINPLRPEKSSSVVTSGVYRFSRNPMYLGMLTVLCGVAFLLKAISGFLLLPVFVLLINRLQIMPEEKALKKLFGDSYQQYLNRVRRWV